MNQENEKLKAENQKLRDENSLLKGEQGKPKIRGNKKPDKNIFSKKDRKKKKKSKAKKPFNWEHPQFLTIIEGSKGKAWLKFL